MTRTTSWTIGPLWPDTTLPLAIGLAGALALLREGGPFWALLVVPILCWCAWQLASWYQQRITLRLLLVGALVVVIVVAFFALVAADTTRLQRAVAAAGIGVDAVSSDRDRVVINIRPVSWGPERNVALRAVFAAAHSHAKIKKRVSIRWGDAMTTTIQMQDIDAFIAGKITYHEIINRMDWSGTPDILPDDSTGSLSIFLTWGDGKQ